MINEALKKYWPLFISVILFAVFFSVFRSQVNSLKTEKEILTQEYERNTEKNIVKYNNYIHILETKLTSKEESFKNLQYETSAKVFELSKENQSLKQSSHKTKLKIVKPDGSIIEKEVENSNSESTKNMVKSVQSEYETKLKVIENKWKTIHEERVSKIKKEYEEKLSLKEKVVKEEKNVKETIEETKDNKQLRIEAGVSTELYPYLHGSYNPWDPIFIGGGISGTNTKFGDIRIGVGVGF